MSPSNMVWVGRTDCANPLWAIWATLLICSLSNLALVATKPMTTQRDLSLAYSPGVAVACEAIAENPADARLYTARGNLVAVVTNGRDSLLLDTITTKVLDQGMQAIPDRKRALAMLPSLIFLPPQDEDKRLREKRILNAFDLERCCIGI